MTTNIKKSHSKILPILGGATEVDEDGQNDADYNEELEDEYDDVEQENDDKSDNNTNTDEYDSDENIDNNKEIVNEYENLEEEEEEEEKEEEEEEEGIGENDTDIDENTQIIEESDGCVYNFAKKSGNESDDEFDEQVFDDDNILSTEETSKIITGDDRISGDRMTKYERVRILAERSKQLMSGAKPMLKNTEGMQVKDIAKAELLYGVTPYRIRRERPDGKIEEWKLSELKIGN